MSKLCFVYSTMNSGKTLELIKTAHYYEERNKKVLIFTSEKDTRNGVIHRDNKIGKVVARIGYSRPAWLIERIDCYEMAKNEKPDCIFVDEVQFLTKDIILKIISIVDNLDIPVTCYGLKCDFQNNLFESSALLLSYSDVLKELEIDCWYCNKKALLNLRMNNNDPVFEGELLLVGGSESYKPVCRRCYNMLKSQKS
ncbi:MAG: hypothetical protein VR72_02560 [Clostridiaceae bacterium BRH_c20a]|nr:MAG: hypothetical protein VR72_02560 [Clostridiaceae bacterium BRH_c20a]